MARAWLRFGYTGLIVWRYQGWVGAFGGGLRCALYTSRRTIELARSVPAQPPSSIYTVRRV